VTQNVLSALPGGIQYIAGSYHTFGVNGSTPVNGSVNNGSDTALDNDLVQDGPTFISASTLYADLTTASDHLPVVADYALTPLNLAPAVTTQPASQTRTVGQTVTFTAAASGFPAPTVRWQLSTSGGAAGTFIDLADNSVYSGTATDTLTFNGSRAAGGVAVQDNGNVYRAVYTNGLGTATTNQAVLTVATGTAASAVAVTSSLNPATVGQGYTLTATVSGGSGTPTGFVYFDFGGGPVPRFLGANGTATYGTTATQAGNFPVSVSYEGDGTYAPGTSPPFTEVVNPVATTTTFASSLNPSAVGQAVTFTATVTPQNGTGTVTFYDGGTVIGTGTLGENSTASFTTSSLAAGTHQITAAYGGDGSYLASTSAALDQVVNGSGVATTTALTLNGISAATAGLSIELGYSPTATVQVTPASGPVSALSGLPVQVQDAGNGNAVVATGSLDATGQVTLALTTGAGAGQLNAGGHNLVAVFPAATGFAASQSAPQNQAVDAVFRVDTLTPTATGFVATFNAPVNPANLFAWGTAATRSIGLTAGASAVPGSVVFDAAATQATFVATGTYVGGVPLANVLTAGASYTPTLSGTSSSPFKDTLGHVLGSGTSTGGANYNTPFTAPTSATAVTVNAPYFARGYHQAVKLPLNSSAGLPISVTVPAGATAVTTATFDVVYDPALLNVTGGSITAGGFAGSVTVTTPGVAHVTLGGGRLAGGTTTPVASLAASVPDTAPYKSKEVLGLRNISVNGGTNNGQDGSAVHVAAFVADADASKDYSPQDAFNVNRLFLGAAEGFAAYQLLDPTVLGDTDATGDVSAQDAFNVNLASIGVPVATIPDLPPGTVTPPATGGPDPKLYIPDVTGAAGPANTALADNGPNPSFPGPAVRFTVRPIGGPTIIGASTGGGRPSLAAAPTVEGLFSLLGPRKSDSGSVSPDNPAPTPAPGAWADPRLFQGLAQAVTGFDGNLLDRVLGPRRRGGGVPF
jgi:hypothetical protein